MVGRQTTFARYAVAEQLVQNLSIKPPHPLEKNLERKIITMVGKGWGIFPENNLAELWIFKDKSEVWLVQI